MEKTKTNKQTNKKQRARTKESKERKKKQMEGSSRKKEGGKVWECCLVIGRKRRCGWEKRERKEGPAQKACTITILILEVHHRPGCKELSGPALDFSILPPLMFVSIYFERQSSRFQNIPC